MKSCSIQAFAKINLTLELLGRRPDGYTEISSLLVPVDLHDTIELREAEHDSLEVTAKGVSINEIGPAENNLCMRAVRLFRERAHLKTGINVKIIKRIPIGGGLGGGSADCAATLTGLNAMQTPSSFDRDSLMSLAAELGSDIPALVHGGAVIMEGRGELVREPAVKPPCMNVVLANPGIHVSTAAAYKAVPQGVSKRPEGTPSINSILTSDDFSCNIYHSSICSGRVSAYAASLFNGLEKTVFELEPKIALLAQNLRNAGSVAVLMSGSGASVFALASSPEDAERIKRSVPIGYWCTVTKTMPDGVMAAHGPLEA